MAVALHLLGVAAQVVGFIALGLGAMLVVVSIVSGPHMRSRGGPGRPPNQGGGGSKR
jgi:hypothetical protein